MENSSESTGTSRIGSVHLRVSDLETALEFYKEILRFKVAAMNGGNAKLAAAADSPVRLILSESRGARPRPAGTTGLYHVAIRFPHRRELAGAFIRLHQARYRLQGFADHGVSEAIYLADPDGNGIELYSDRPAEDWPFADGQLVMTTEPLDMENLLSELQSGDPGQDALPPATDIGHIHLQVSDLSRSEKFYHETLGFDLTQRSLPGALFLSSGGYHHHIGLNTWAGRGALSPPADALGLVSYSIVFSDSDAIRRIIRNNPDAVRVGGEVEDGNAERFTVRDPDGVTITLVDMSKRAEVSRYSSTP